MQPRLLAIAGLTFPTAAACACLPQVGTTSTKSGRERFQQATGLPAPEVNGKAFPIQLGFTKTNELFVGRLAMLGFAASLVGELLTGQGALAQFGYGEQGPGREQTWA